MRLKDTLICFRSCSARQMPYKVPPEHERRDPPHRRDEMIRPVSAFAPAFAIALSCALFAGSPALAQDDGPIAGDERVNQIIVYGDDPCPPSSAEEITVCARKAEDERYRIPEILRLSEAPENISWTQRVEAYETVGSFGVMSCSPSGAGGWTGCAQQLIDAAYAEKRGSSDIRFSELIQQEREKRLSTIDADAAAEQERVEQIEREYEARLAREREAALPDETPSGPAPLPPIGESAGSSPDPEN